MAQPPQPSEPGAFVETHDTNGPWALPAICYWAGGPARSTASGANLVRLSQVGSWQRSIVPLPRLAQLWVGTAGRPVPEERPQASPQRRGQPREVRRAFLSLNIGCSHVPRSLP